jgi:hypothetical protein
MTATQVDPFGLAGWICRLLESNVLTCLCGIIDIIDLALGGLSSFGIQSGLAGAIVERLVNVADCACDLLGMANIIGCQGCFNADVNAVDVTAPAIIVGAQAASCAVNILSVWTGGQAILMWVVELAASAVEFMGLLNTPQLPTMLRACCEVCINQTELVDIGGGPFGTFGAVSSGVCRTLTLLGVSCSTLP